MIPITINYSESIFYHTHISLSRVQEISICLLTINLSIKQNLGILAKSFRQNDNFGQCSRCTRQKCHCAAEVWSWKNLNLEKTGKWKLAKIHQSFLVNFRILGRAPAAQGENAIVQRKPYSKTPKWNSQYFRSKKRICYIDFCGEFHCVKILFLTLMSTTYLQCSTISVL